MSSNNSFPEPGSEINSVHKNVSPAGLQARAAATQSQAPAGTYLSDTTQQTTAASSSQQPYSGVNTISTDHDPSLNFSSPGMQARAAAAGQAPAGTAQPEYLSPESVESSAPRPSPMGIAPDTIHPSHQTPPSHIQAEPEPVPHTPINSLNTAREVFQPTSSNQPQAAVVEEPEPVHASYTAPPQYSYGPNSANEAPSSFAPQQSAAGQIAQRAATQTAQSAPAGTHYTGPNSSQAYIGPNSAGQSQFSGHQSSAGAMARTAATQTPGSAPAGTRYTSSTGQFSQPPKQQQQPYSYNPQTPSNQQTRSASNAPTQAASYPSQAPMRSGAGSAARAFAAGAHPPGTGPDAGILAQASANLASQNSAPRFDASKNFSSAGAQARAAAAGSAPTGTGSSYPRAAQASQEASYEPPSSTRFNHAAETAVSPGLQARAAAYGQHPPGTGPGSVKGVRSYSTMSRLAPTVIKAARLLRK